MLAVAIVEDEETYSTLLEGYLKKYEQEKEVSIRITHYKDAVSFLTKYQPIFDLIFMDIQMPYITGIDAAEHLRQLDPDVPLVFVTSYVQYAPKGYNVSAAGFLVKPVSYYSFYTLLDKIVRRAATQNREHKLNIHTRESVMILPYSEIKYIEISGHNLKYVTERGVYEATGSFTALERELPETQFVRCSNSFIVHLKFVKGTMGNVVQVGEHEIPISRSRKKNFICQLMRYYGDRM